jgi:dTDP-4-dehydrorhamnose 3,5-epimerase
MLFTETRLKGAFIIQLEKRGDERGFFARTFCQKEFSDYGLNTRISQANLAYSRFKGTLRGMHYQAKPHAEAKLVRCTKGAVFDVAVDLRPDSATYCQWFGVELTSDNYKMFYIPEDFAHGYMTIEDHCELTYMVSAFYAPDAERGARWDDPSFKIKWPLSPEVISDKDKKWADFNAAS